MIERAGLNDKTKRIQISMSQQVLDIVDEERARFNLSRSAYINTLIGAKHEEMSNSAIVSAISGNSKLERSNE